MTDHDWHFKSLLRTFLLEFLQLFAPEIIALGPVTDVTFMDKELFAQFPKPIRRNADLVARLTFTGDVEGIAIVHTEVQSHPEPAFALRMLAYFALLQSAHPNTPVYPIALFTYDAVVRHEPASCSISLPGRGEILRFAFTAVRLRRLHWRDFLTRPNPAAAALMAKMGFAPDERAEVKAACIRMAAGLRLSRPQLDRIGRFVETYLPLSASEQVQYNQIVEALPMPEREAVQDTLTYWERKGLEQGLEQGREQGLARGRREGELRLLLRLLEHRFGTVPAADQALLLGLAETELDDLALGLSAAVDYASWREQLQQLAERKR